MGNERVFGLNGEHWRRITRGGEIVFSRTETDSISGIKTTWEKNLGRPFCSVRRFDELPNGGSSRKIFGSFWDNQLQAVEYTFCEESSGFSRQIQLYEGVFEIGYFLEGRDFEFVGATYNTEDGSVHDITISPGRSEKGKEDFYIELIKDPFDPTAYIFSAELLEDELHEDGGTLLNEIVRIGEEFKFRGFSYTISNSNNRASIEITNLLNQRVLQIEFPEKVDVEKFRVLIADTEARNWSKASEIVPSSVVMKEPISVS